MKLDGTNGFLEIERCEAGPPNTPGENDLLLGVSVKVAGYSANDQAWIVSNDFQSFLKELQTLDSKRQGRALLEGASPDDLRLEFFSTDSAGHMAVKGHLGWHNSELHFQQLRFGFDFEPDKLPAIVREFEKLGAPYH